MSGRPDFSQAGSQGSGQTVAVSNRPEIQTVAVTQTTTLSPGQSETTEVYAPSGSVYNLTAMYLRADSISSATTGNHRFTLGMAGIDFMRNRAAYSSNIVFNFGHWFQGSGRPANEGAQATLIQTARATENKAVSVRYLNESGTDADQTSNRSIRFLFEEVSY